MARAPNENVGIALELYKSGMKLVEIASQLNIPPGTVRRWKSTYKWDSERSDINERSENKTKKEESDFIKKATQVLEGSELTEKQRLFCLYYIKNFNATLAAVKAGYEPNTARQIGYENLTKPYIKAEIQRLKQMKKESIMLNEDDIVERYMNIAFADITDFVEFGQEQQPVLGAFGPIEVEDPKTGEKTVLTEMVNVIKFKSSDIVDGGLICEISKGKAGMKVKLEDRQKALDWLSRYFLMNPLDKHKLDYDNKKLEIEKLKLKDDDPEDTEDDGFIDALKGQVDEIWQD